MNGSNNTIGLSDLLDEVSGDLDDFRRKHQSDYGVKNITLWWDMERERIATRHKEARVVPRVRPRRLWLLAGASIVMFAAGVGTTLALL